MAEEDPTYIYKIAIAILIVGLALLSWYLLSVKSKRDELSVTAESLRSTNMSLSKQIEDLKQTLAGKDVIIAELQETKAKAAGLAASLNQQYAELAKASELDKAALAASATSLADRNATIAENKATIDRINLNIAMLQDQLAVLRDKNNSLTTQLADATRNAEDATRNAADANALNASLNGKLVDVMNLYNVASSQLAAQKQANQSLSTQLDAQKNANTSLTSQLDLKNSELARLNAQITQLTASMEELRKNMSNANACAGLTGEAAAQCMADNQLGTFLTLLRASNTTLIRAARIYYATNAKPTFKPIAEQYLNTLDKVIAEFTVYYQTDFIPKFTEFINKYFYDIYGWFPRMYFTFITRTSLNSDLTRFGRDELKRRLTQVIGSCLAYGLGLTDGMYFGYPSNIRIDRYRTTPESLARTPIGAGVGVLYEKSMYSKETVDLILLLCDMIGGYIAELIIVSGGADANLQKNLTSIGLSADVAMNYIKNSFILTSVEVLRETHDIIYNLT